MATAEHPHLTTADERAWDLFFAALDADNEAAHTVPPGAAIVAADASDRDELVRRYRADRRAVVLVHEDGRQEVISPRLVDRTLIVTAVLALAAWAIWRSGQRASA
jgi:hypothetical protein